MLHFLFSFPCFPLLSVSSFLSVFTEHIPCVLSVLVQNQGELSEFVGSSSHVKEGGCNQPAGQTAWQGTPVKCQVAVEERVKYKVAVGSCLCECARQGCGGVLGSGAQAARKTSPGRESLGRALRNQPEFSKRTGGERPSRPRGQRKRM